MNPVRIILGTAQLGLDYGVNNRSGKPSIVEARGILDAAHEIGIDILDTAIAYGDSERLLGEISNGRFKLMSKWIGSPHEIDLSLNRLRADRLQVWFAHRPEKIQANPDLWHLMLEQKKSGKAEKLGVSVYEIGEVRRLWDLGIEPEVVQIPINLLSENSSDMCTELHAHGCEIHARSVFLQGVLLASPADLPSHFKPLRTWLEEFMSRFPSKMERAQVLVNYVLDEVGVDFVVLGAEATEQVLEWGHCMDVEFKRTLPCPPAGLDKAIINPSLWPKS